MITFEKVLNFAIEQEIKAAEYYSKLQEKTKDKNICNTLKKLANMEQEHAKALSNLKRDDAASYSDYTIEHIKPFDLLPEPDCNNFFECQLSDIFLIAVNQERITFNLYKKMAGSVDMPIIKKTFLKLASEEMKHRKILEKLYVESLPKSGMKPEMMKTVIANTAKDVVR